MDHKMLLPSVEEFALLLQKCRRKGSREQVLHLHTSLCHNGLDVHPLLGNHLVVALVESGCICHAQHVFIRLIHRRELSWGSLISGYVKCGESQHALILYQRMQHVDSLYPSGHTLVTLLKACALLKDADQAQQLHDEITRQGLLQTDTFVGSSLVDVYAKCGYLEKAQEVFDKLPIRDVVSWTTLIRGYAEHDYGEDALNCVKQMQEMSIPHDAVTLLCSLKACGCIGASNMGQEFHSEIIKMELETNLLIGSALVDMYAQVGLLAEAQEVFSTFFVKDVVLWNALLSAFVAHGHAEKALDCLKKMQDEGILPDLVTFLCSLKACACVGDIVKGYKIHGEIVSRGFERKPFVGNILVDMYAKFALLATAQEVFDKLPAHDIVTWTALIAGYVEQGCDKEALHCFKQMPDDDVVANDITFVYILKACGNIGAATEGLEIHAEILIKGMESVTLVGNTLVDMYQQLGSSITSQQVFDKLKVRDVVSWNAHIAGYIENGHGEKAFDCFEQMQQEGVYPSDVTFSYCLKACASTEATDKGHKLHIEIVRKGLETGLLVSSMLVNMYAKCGLLAEAYHVFATLPFQDNILWNALIAACAQVGRSDEVVRLFDKMIGEGCEPDLATVANILNACSHTGLVDKGHVCFEAMSNDAGFVLSLEHYACMVDLLGRAGHVERAVAVVENMPMHPDFVMWDTVLAACRKWGNVDLGRHAFGHALQLNEKGSYAYLCMYNIYSDATVHEEGFTRFSKDELDTELLDEYM